ncbi:hypothetical protein FKW77_002479 [Venturia effusa]|uniref:Uncharacterized protein n=1 Tax=Venturia effusa TaxID=50376 RepID=A0A517LF03_9PEZI|nr:hypothetical protein FKW77_002479 [Venturia effusa]
MKASVILSLLFAVVSVASPTSNANKEELSWWTITTKGKVDAQNHWLSLKDGKVGGFAGARETPDKAGKFFTAVYPPTGTSQLLSGNWDHQLGLKVSTKGVMQLVDLGRGPTSAIIPKDAPNSIEWGVFQVGPSGEITVKDGADIPSRQWISWLDTDGVYYTGLWDGFTRQPRSFANITLVATKTEPLFT